MLKTTRRALGAFVLAFAIVGCGQAQNSASNASGPAKGVMSMGEADAPILIQEYASVTCIHCKHFHDDVWPMLKTEFIATGLVRFEFHDFPTPPADLAVAGFAVARCAGPENYYKVLDDLFDNRDGLIRAYTAGQAGPALGVLAARHGLDQEAYEACLSNEDILRDINDVIQAGDARGVNSTPTFFINGKMVTDGKIQTVDGMRDYLNEQLEELGVSTE